MSTQEWWWLGLGLGAVVVAVVAVLLGLIIAAARSIDRHAAEIWVVGKQIAGNTGTIWTLSQIAGLGPRLRRAAESLVESAAGIEAAVAGDTQRREDGA